MYDSSPNEDMPIHSKEIVPLRERALKPMATTCVHIVRKANISEELSAITEPLIKEYARRIGADVNVIGATRAFPDYPSTYERMQIYASGRAYEWNICVDTDILLGSSLIDATTVVPPQFVGLIMSYKASDVFPVENHYFRRDGRDMVPVESFVVTSQWTHDLWEPLRGSSMSNMALVFHEHQIAEYALAHNIAKYGLKYAGAFPGGSQIARVSADQERGVSEVQAAHAILRQWGCS